MVRSLATPRLSSILAVLIVGCGLRALASVTGYNYDFRSYVLVAEILERGEPVYMATWRYNYGPIWFLVLRAFDLLAGSLPFDRELGFRGLIVALLTFADVAIAAALFRRVSPLAAAIFFLNPISILITGFHNQFDNLALSIGLTATQLFSRGDDQRIDRWKLAALALLGFSLMTKHVLFAFPLWLALRQRGWWQRGVVLGLPVALFLASFAPFWAEAQPGILAHVFRYGSGNNSPLYALPPLATIESVISRRFFWYGGLVLGAVLLRRVELFQAVLLYTGILVALSPAMTNQYLAIPMALIAAQINPGFLVYIVIATWHLIVDGNGLYVHIPGVPVVDRLVYYAWVLAAFWVGMIWMVVRQWRQATAHAEKRRTYETKA